MPSEALWSRVTVDLRGLQDRISTVKRYFESARQPETAEKLEKAIELLVDAQHVAEELARTDLVKRGRTIDSGSSCNSHHVSLRRRTDFPILCRLFRRHQVRRWRFI